MAEPVAARTAFFDRIRASTGTKTFLILTLALLPLGLIALFSSLQASRAADQERAALLSVAAGEAARNLTAEIASHGAALRVVVNALSADDSEIGLCARADSILRSRGVGHVQFVIYNRNGRRVCASQEETPVEIPQTLRFNEAPADLIPATGKMIVRIESDNGRLIAIALYNRAHLEQVMETAKALGSHYIALRKNGTSMPVGGTRALQSGKTESASAEVGGTGIIMDLTVRKSPVSLSRTLSVFMPLIMWIAAAAIGWFVVSRLLIYPLTQLRRTVAAYRPGEVMEPLQRMRTPAREIRDLGDTFRAITQTVADHEAELAAGLARQTRLTREVHHRVKNNLQIIASLINLHSRSAVSAEATDAYASIQRRVDALSVVHRNHYAELEENQGVGVRSLISELAASLSSGARDDSGTLSIHIDCDHLFVTQDVAVPVAFLITEIVELAMKIEPHATLTIAVKKGGDAGRATLRIRSAALADAPELDALLGESFGRVLTGLSRQLRAPLLHDGIHGDYSIEIMAHG